MADRRNGNVSLGCGTLILIAIIVAIFSGAGQVQDLEAKIDTLTEEIRVLQEKVDAFSSVLENKEIEPPMAVTEAATP